MNQSEKSDLLAAVELQRAGDGLREIPTRPSLTERDTCFSCSASPVASPPSIAHVSQTLIFRGWFRH